MLKSNVVLFDNSKEETIDFIKGLENATNEKWESKILRANQGRNNVFSNLFRYIKYFVFPFFIFLKRKKYKKLIGWQSFYGVIFAFYCRVFHVKKNTTVLIKNFTYKPKKGLVGKIFFRFMKYVVKSKYIDIFVCTSQTFCDYCADVFEEPKHRFIYLPFGVMDFTKCVDMSEEPSNDYILSLGRSNRDWDFLIDSLEDTDYSVKIVCDELHREDTPKNIKIYNNVWGKESYEFIKNCKMMIIPIMDGQIGSGETVLIQAMSFSKPIIITKPSCLADDYIDDKETGIIVSKDKESLINAVSELYNNQTLYNTISRNCRKKYDDDHSLLKYGERVGIALEGR